MKFIVLLAFIVFQALSSEPNPPVWPSSVKIIEQGDQTAQGIVDQIFNEQGGHIPSCHGQFSEKRYAILFKPGVHNLRVNVGYYTHVMGLGNSPYDTQIQAVISENGDYNFQIGALNNFWRMAENFYTRPTEIYNNVPQSMLWAVSQASPLRRVVVEGNLQIYQYNYGDAAGYASGGYMSDISVTGSVYSGSQQQFMIRNSRFGSWVGALWNYVFVGTDNAPSSNCQDSGSSATVNIPQTPVIAEKPFIVFENGKYYLAVPNLKFNSRGISNYNDLTKIDFSQVYVATENDSAATINAKLDSGLHLVLTPGQYKLSESLRVNHGNTVVLGLGLATLIATNGQPCIVVGNVDGVRVSGLLLEAGKVKATSLIQWGSKGYAGSEANPGILQDCFTRVGGPNDPNIYQVSTEKMVEINSGNVVLDDLWLWRADHHIGGITKSSQNPTDIGIEVNGDHVTAYGLASEHCLKDLVSWNGNFGKVYFYQSEFPYDVTQENYGNFDFVSYRVGNQVTSHEAYGIGVYSYFADYDVKIKNAIKTPNNPGVKVVNALTVFLNGKGSINHIINDQGESVQGPSFMIKYKCNTQGNGSQSFLE